MRNNPNARFYELRADLEKKGPQEFKPASPPQNQFDVWWRKTGIRMTLPSNRGACRVAARAAWNRALLEMGAFDK